jgi:hypothetical protein
MILTFNCTKVDFVVCFFHVNLGKEILFLPIYSPNDIFNNWRQRFRNLAAFVDWKFWKIFPTVANGCFLYRLGLSSSNLIDGN